MLRRCHGAKGRFNREVPYDFSPPVLDNLGGIQADPYGIHHYVQRYVRSFDVCLHRLRDAEPYRAGRPSLLPDMMPVGPHVESGVQRGSRFNQHARCLADPPPNDLRADRALEAFLARPPITVGDKTIHLRGMMLTLLQTYDAHIRNGIHAKDLVGNHGSSIVMNSIITLLPAAAPRSMVEAVRVEWDVGGRSAVQHKPLTVPREESPTFVKPSPEHWASWRLPEEGDPEVYELCRHMRNRSGAVDLEVASGHQEIRARQDNFPTDAPSRSLSIERLNLPPGSR